MEAWSGSRPRPNRIPLEAAEASRLSEPTQRPEGFLGRGVGQTLPELGANMWPTRNISSTFINIMAQNLLIFLIVASEKFKSQHNRSQNICEHLWTISPSLWAGIHSCAASPTFSYFHLWPEHPTPPVGIKPNLQHWAEDHGWCGSPAWWAQVSTVCRVLWKEDFFQEISWLIVKVWQH